MYPIPEYGTPLILAQAKALAQHAEAEAQEHGWRMVIAVADSAGHLVLLHRMDHAQFGSLAVAQAKALTAVNFKRPTSMFEKAVASGGTGLRALSIEGICAVEGGVPVVLGGKLVGAIGVSGADAHEDGLVARAALRAFGSEVQ